MTGHARSSANKLRQKYKIGAENDASLFGSLLDQPGGEKAAVDAAIRSLANRSESNINLVLLAGELERRRSPQLFRLLEAAIRSEETGQTNFAAPMLSFLSNYVTKENIPDDLKKRFLRLVMQKARSAIQSPGGDVEGFFQLISDLLLTAKNFGDLLPDIEVIYLSLKTQVAREVRETEERNERIRSSSDKLNTITLEAEKTQDGPIRADLYQWAAQVALKEKKFSLAVDLAEKVSAIEGSLHLFTEDSRKLSFEQFLQEAITAALKSDEVSSVPYALKKFNDPLKKAASLRELAIYYFKQNDMGSAASVLAESIKLASKAESSDTKFTALIGLLNIAQKIDPNRVSGLIDTIAKAINSIPSLDPDKKPGSAEFNARVVSLRAINQALLTATMELVRANRNEALSLAGKINNKEIKIIAEFALHTDPLNLLPASGQKTKDRAAP